MRGISAGYINMTLSSFQQHDFGLTTRPIDALRGRLASARLLGASGFLGGSVQRRAKLCGFLGLLPSVVEFRQAIEPLADAAVGRLTGINLAEAGQRGGE